MKLKADAGERATTILYPLCGGGAADRSLSHPRGESIKEIGRATRGAMP